MQEVLRFGADDVTRVHKFTYRGNVVSEVGGKEEDIASRRAKAQETYYGRTTVSRMAVTEIDPKDQTQDFRVQGQTFTALWVRNLVGHKKPSRLDFRFSSTSVFAELLIVVKTSIC